jgi:hypothetical protein
MIVELKAHAINAMLETLADDLDLPIIRRRAWRFIAKVSLDFHR